jgi:methionine-rich copper-binding protein CopC
MKSFTRTAGAAALLLAFGTALAHPTLVGSTPKNGEALASTPHQIRILFSEPIESAFTHVKVVGGAGKSIGIEPARPDPTDAKAVVVQVPALAAGAYKVQWSALGRDGHRVKGEIAFSVK